MISKKPHWFIMLIIVLLISSCQAQNISTTSNPETSPINVLTSDSIIADITRNIAGDKVNVNNLIPLGIDPHTFEPTPKDVVRIKEADLLVINGAGYEGWLEKLLENARGNYLTIEASKGLSMRIPRETEEDDHEDASSLVQGEAESSPIDSHHHHDGDPHFWLNPLLVKTYVENIRDGLIELDPSGQEIYSANALTYQQKLDDLDRQIKSMVAEVPRDHRILVTNHESFGYYADRYGFSIIGTIIPGISSGSSPSALQIVNLIKNIKSVSAPAIFLEAGSNPDIAEQITKETHVKLVTGLITHSLTDKNGGADTYIKMMLYNTKLIVDGLR